MFLWWFLSLFLILWGERNLVAAEPSCPAYLRVAGKLMKFEPGLAGQLKLELRKPLQGPQKFSVTEIYILEQVIESLAKNLAVRVEASGLEGKARASFTKTLVLRARRVLLEVATGYFERNETQEHSSKDLVAKILRYSLRKLKPDSAEMGSTSKVFEEFRAEFLDRPESLKLIDETLPSIFKLIQRRSKELYRKPESRTAAQERALRKAKDYLDQALERGYQHAPTLFRAVKARISDADYRPLEALQLGSGDLESKIEMALKSATFSGTFNKSLSDRISLALRSIQSHSIEALDDEDLFSQVFLPERERILERASTLSLQFSEPQRWKPEEDLQIYDQIESVLFEKAKSLFAGEMDLTVLDQNRALIESAKKIVELRMRAANLNRKISLSHYLEALSNLDLGATGGDPSAAAFELATEVLVAEFKERSPMSLGSFIPQPGLLESLLERELRARLEVELLFASLTQASPRLRAQRQTELIQKFWSMTNRPGVEVRLPNQASAIIKRAELLPSFIQEGVSGLDKNDLHPANVRRAAIDIQKRIRVYLSPAIKYHADSLKAFAGLYENLPVEFVVVLYQLLNAEPSALHTVYRRLRTRMKNSDGLNETYEQLKVLWASELMRILSARVALAEIPSSHAEALKTADELGIQMLEFNDQAMEPLAQKAILASNAIALKAQFNKPAAKEVKIPESELPFASDKRLPIFTYAEEITWGENVLVAERELAKLLVASQSFKKLYLESLALIEAGSRKLTGLIVGAKPNLIPQELKDLKLMLEKVESPSPEIQEKLLTLNFTRQFLRKVGDALMATDSKNEEELTLRSKLVELMKSLDNNFYSEMRNRNSGLVVAVLRAGNYPSTEWPDLMQVGNMTLLRAIRLWQPEMKNRFSSYAFEAMRLEIVKERWVNQEGSTPDSRRNVSMILRAQDEYMKRLARKPNVEEIMQSTGLKATQVYKGLNLMRQFSLNAPQGDGSDSFSALSWIEDTKSMAESRPPGPLLKKEWFVYLDERETIALEASFGINGRKKITHEQIGASLGLSREKARQLVHIAEEKMAIAIYAAREGLGARPIQILLEVAMQAVAEKDFQRVATKTDSSIEYVTALYKAFKHEIGAYLPDLLKGD